MHKYGTTVRIPSKLADRIDRLARRRSMNRSEIVRGAVVAELERVGV